MATTLDDLIAEASASGGSERANCPRRARLSAPFVVLVDVGHVIELYADFSGQGKNYAGSLMPSRSASTWKTCAIPPSRPASRQCGPIRTASTPAKKSAEVTRDIAGRLSTIANFDKLPLKPDIVGTRFANQYAEIGTALGLKALALMSHLRLLAR